MQYLYAALILHKSEQEITAPAVTKVLKAAGVTPEAARVKTLVAAIDEIDIEEALASASMMAVAAPAAAGAAEAPEAAAEEAVEEEEEEEGEELDEDDGLGALFG